MTTPVPHRILGLHVTDRVAAAVVLSAETGEMVRVPVVTDTVLYLLPDGSSSLHRPDPDTAPDGVDVVDRFVERVGDPAGVVSAHGAVLRAEDLLATVLLHLIDRTRPDADVVAVAYPGSWTADQVAALRDSLEFLSLTGVDLLPDTVLPGAPDEPLDVALAAARHAGGLAPPPAAAPTVVVPAGVGRRRLPVVLAAAAAAVALAAAVTGAIVVTADRTVAPEVPAIADAVPATGTSATAAPTTSRSTGPFPTVTAEDVAAVVPSVTAPRTPDSPAPAAPAPPPAPAPAPVVPAPAPVFPASPPADASPPDEPDPVVTDPDTGTDPDTDTDTDPGSDEPANPGTETDGESETDGGSGTTGT